MSIVKGRNNYLAFDGVDDAINMDAVNFALHEQPIGYLELTVEVLSFPSSGSNFIVSARNDGDNRLYVMINPNNTLAFFVGDSNLLVSNLNTNQKYDLKLEWNNGVAEVFIDNISQGTFNYSVEGGNDRNYKIGRDQNDTVFTAYANFNLYSYKHVDNGVDFIVWDNSQDTGTTFVNTAGANGTIENATWQSEANAIQNIYYGRTSYLTFDGLDDDILFNDNLSINQFPFEVEVNVLFNSFANEARPDIFSSDGTNSWDGFKLYYLDDIGRLQLTVGNGNDSGDDRDYYLYTNITFNTNQVYNIRVDWQSLSSGPNVYIDNVLYSPTGSQKNISSVNWNTNYRIGSRSGTANFLDGEINYLRVNVNNNDVHEYLFNEGSGTTLGDNISNVDGTINGATWNGEGVPVPRIYLGSTLVFGEAPIPTYDLIADVNVQSNTTQIDFDNLNITKDDELRLVYTIIGDDASTFGNYGIEVNNDTTTTNYNRQFLYATGTTRIADRINDNFFFSARSNRRFQGISDIKISNNNRFVAQLKALRTFGSNASNIEMTNVNIVNTTTITSITKLSVVSDRTNGIATGSRLQLYKLNTGSA